MSSWWPWGQQVVPAAKPTDAAHDPALRLHFMFMIDQTEPPAFFKASDVAKLLTDKELARLGYESWKDAIPAVYELAWEMRDFGSCLLLKNGKIIPDDVDMLDVEGPVRIMRKKNYRPEQD